jgi:excinuclease ABC subunit C
MTDQLQDQLNTLPLEPGIYKYFDAAGELIYVGKAVNLKNRVKSYFSGPQSPKTQVLVSNIVRLETIVVQSEVDALILEANLIKEHRPRYNIILKDDKSYLYIKITVYEDFPRVSTCRQTDMYLDPKATYFGPYPSSSIVKQTLRYLRRVFAYLAHHQPPMAGRRRPPQSFFYYNLPLLSETVPLEKREYRKEIFRLIAFLEGKRYTIAEDLQKEMREAARVLDFEQAGYIKLQLESIAYMTQRTISPDQYVANPELLQERRADGLRDLARVLTPFFPELGNMAPAEEGMGEISALRRVECYDISNTGGQQSVGSMVVFEHGEALKRDYRKFKITLGDTPNDFAMMEEVLTRRFKRHLIAKKPTITTSAQTLDDAHAVEYSVVPADSVDHSFAALPDLIVIDGGKGQLSSAESVLATLGLTIPIVGVTKRYEELVIAKEAVGAPHDAMLTDDRDHVFNETNTLARDSIRPTKAKRSSAHGAIARTASEAQVAVQTEQHFTMVRLARGSEALFFIQRLRDEAHRFAITYHRKLRAKSFLDDHPSTKKRSSRLVE